MKSTPLISVVMNCHNGGKYLKEAIDSVYAQSYSNWEIIFLDNASVDDSEVIAQSYDSKLRYYKTPSLVQLHEARNLAIEKCKGDAVAFLDTDDVWLSDKLERQIKLLTKDCKVVYGAYEFIDQYSNRTGIVQDNCPSGFLTATLIRMNPISIGSVMIDSELIKEFKFDENYSIMGDFDLWVRLSHDYVIKSVNGTVELSRQHENNFSDIQKNKWLGERRYFYRKFLRSNSLFKFPGIILYIIKTEFKGLINAR